MEGTSLVRMRAVPEVRTVRQAADEPVAEVRVVLTIGISVCRRNRLVSCPS